MTLQLVDVAVEYDGRFLYRNASLTVDTGEIVSLVGPSGSGKSTLLRIIAGIETPSHGRVLLDGRDITDVPIHRRGIGMVFQDNQLFPHLDVAGNIGYGLRMNRHRSPDRVDERATRLGAGLVILLTVLSLGLGHPLPPFLLAVDFTLRGLGRPAWSPVAQVAQAPCPLLRSRC